jgi:Protein of unknown function (DUF3617)
MKKFLVATALLSFAATAAIAEDNPFAAMKGKVKPGMYENKMEMEIPGMPAGMGPQSFTNKTCLTDADLEKGAAFNKGRDGKAASDCAVKDFKMTGSGATYKMVCTGASKMEGDTTLTFMPDGYKGVTKMSMMQGGQAMNVTSKFESKYLGTCTK